jgi:hypothetical protein
MSLSPHNKTQLVQNQWMESRIIRAVLEMFDYCADVESVDIDTLIENDDEDLVVELGRSILATDVEILQAFACIRKTLKYGKTTETNREVVRIAKVLVELCEHMFPDNQFYCEDEEEIVHINTLSVELVKLFDEILENNK